MVAELRSLAQRAIVVDYDDARGHLLAGIAEMWLRNTAEAETLFRRAIAINPSLVIAYEQLATLDILTGRPAEAIEMMVFALRLGPSDYRLFFKHGEIGLAYLLAGRFEDAVRHAKESIILRPRYWYAHVVRINALVRLGQLSAAADAYRDLVAARPNFSPAYIDWIPFVETAGADYLREGLALVALSG